MICAIKHCTKSTKSIPSIYRGRGREWRKKYNPDSVQFNRLTSFMYFWAFSKHVACQTHQRQQTIATFHDACSHSLPASNIRFEQCWVCSTACTLRNLCRSWSIAKTKTKLNVESIFFFTYLSRAIPLHNNHSTVLVNPSNVQCWHLMRFYAKNNNNNNNHNDETMEKSLHSLEVFFLLPLNRMCLNVWNKLYVSIWIFCWILIITSTLRCGWEWVYTFSFMAQTFCLFYVKLFYLCECECESEDERECECALCAHVNINMWQWNLAIWWEQRDAYVCSMFTHGM